MPDIVVGDMRHAGVTNFGFAGEEGFGAGGHAHQTHAPTAEDVAFGFGAKARAFDGDEGAALMHGGRGRLDGLVELGGEISAKRIGHADVTDKPVAKEGTFAAFGVVENLVGDDDVAGGVIVAQRAAGADRNDAFNAQQFEGVDVGAVVDFGGSQPVAFAVAGEKGDFDSVEVADHHWVAGRAKGCDDVTLFDIIEADHVVQARAADDGEGDFVGHGLILEVRGKRLLVIGYWLPVLEEG